MELCSDAVAGLESKKSIPSLLHALVDKVPEPNLNKFPGRHPKEVLKAFEKAKQEVVSQADKCEDAFPAQLADLEGTTATAIAELQTILIEVSECYDGLKLVADKVKKKKKSTENKTAYVDAKLRARLVQGKFGPHHAKVICL